MFDVLDETGHSADSLNLTWDLMPEEFRGHYVDESLSKEPYSVLYNTAMTTIYSVLLFLGLLGNIMTLIVISWEKGSKSPANLFLISLSLADIITLIIGNYLVILIISI